MNLRTITLLSLLLLPIALVAQQADDSTRWQTHVSMGTDFASGFGRTQSLLWVAPSVEYHATNRLTLKTGFATANSLLPQGYRPLGFNARSLAPRRQGTNATMVWASAEYQASERLWLWASIARLAGFAQPLWLDHSMPLQATAFNGGFAYEFSNGSLLECNVHIVHDTYGSTFGLMYNPYSDPWAPAYTLFEGPWHF